MCPLLEVVRGHVEDMGHAKATELPTIIFGDNDATLRIAADAGSAKRALHILRRMGHSRYLTDLGLILGAKIPRELNLADIGTHYCTREILSRFFDKCHGASPQVKSRDPRAGAS